MELLGVKELERAHESLIRNDTKATAFQMTPLYHPFFLMIGDCFHDRRQFVRPSGQPVGLDNTAVPGLSPALTNTWS